MVYTNKKNTNNTTLSFKDFQNNGELTKIGIAMEQHKGGTDVG